MANLKIKINPISVIYVAIQCVLIVGIGYFSRVPQYPALLVLAASGILLMIWALLTMRLSNLNIMPDVKADSTLVTSGPYKYIRHPMYLAVMITMLALVLDLFSWTKLVFWCVLTADLYLKFRYEESLMLKEHPAYADYMKKTKRLIPYIF